MSTSNWLNASRNNPCPKCQKTSWCRKSRDGEVVICQRFDDGTGIERSDVNGQPYWLYPVRDSKVIPFHTKVLRPQYKDEPPVYSTKEVNGVYRIILESLSLLPEHRANLLARGLTDHEINLREYKSLTAEDLERVGSDLSAGIRQDCLKRIPGLYEENGKWKISGPTGMLVPVRDFQDNVVALKVRRDSVDYGPKYIYLSSSRHNGPSIRASVHVPIFEGPDVTEVRITEGELKADIATTLSGMLTLGLPGLGGWKQAIPILQGFGTKLVRIAFDSDHDENQHVARAIERTVTGLLVEGFQVEVEQWKS